MKTPKLNQLQLEGWKLSPKYPLMYCTTKVGKVRVWACWVNGNVVYRTDGLIDGKLKEPQTHKYDGNTLRTGAQQALLEAEKMWLKQFDHDYRPADDDITGKRVAKHVQQQKEQNGGMNRGVKLFSKTEITTGTTAGKTDLGTRHCPMLAKKYMDYDKSGEFVLTNPGKEIKFPAIAQAKVDGIRALPRLENEQVILESRNGKSFVHLNHVRDEIKYWLEHEGYPDMVLDGELYVHQLYRGKDDELTFDVSDRELTGVERFQFLSEACKITRSNPHEREEIVEYWIFDIWDPSKLNRARWKLLQEIFADYDGDIIKLVPTRFVNSHSEIEKFMEELVGETTGRKGYEFEGLMIRQSGAIYEARNNYHSSHLLKYKRFEDEEWEVYDAEKCVGGTQDGAIKWLCQKKIMGKRCKVIAKQMGDAKTTKKLYKAYIKNPNKYIGEMINIRFNDRTKDGVPRFPRATVFPEDK